MKRQAFVTGFVLGLPYGIAAVIISLKIHFFIAVWLASLVFLVLGDIYGARYLRRQRINEKWLKLLFWSNSITWLVPPLGFFTSGSTRIINSRNQAEDSRLFKGLASFCFFACLIVATILVNELLHR